MSPGFYFLLLENRLSIFFAFFPTIIQSLKNLNRASAFAYKLEIYLFCKLCYLFIVNLNRHGKNSKKPISTRKR